MLDELLIGFNTTIDPWKLVLNLFLAVLLGFAVSVVYVLGVPRADRKMARLFPVLAAAMALASSLIASSIGIAIGLVGALSIIRFRTLVKSLEQMVFLFMAIGVGLAATTGHFITGSIAILLFSVHVFVRSFLREREGELFRVSIQGEGQTVGPLIDNLLKTHPKLQFESLDQQLGHTTWLLSLEAKSNEEVMSMREHLSSASGISYSLTTADEIP